MYMIKFVLTIQNTFMTVTIYTELLIQLRVYVVFEGQIKALATVAKSKPIILATW